jgi:hypothetical protein
MKQVLAIAVTLLMAQVSMAGPSAYCNPERSKPCGKGCIGLTKTCRTPWTTAVSGVNPNKSSKKGYETPKYVESAPTKAVK